jgi:hypothetical protein
LFHFFPSIRSKDGRNRPAEFPPADFYLQNTSRNAMMRKKYAYQHMLSIAFLIWLNTPGQGVSAYFFQFSEYEKAAGARPSGHQQLRRNYSGRTLDLDSGMQGLRETALFPLPGVVGKVPRGRG